MTIACLNAQDSTDLPLQSPPTFPSHYHHTQGQISNIPWTEDSSLLPPWSKGGLMGEGHNGYYTLSPGFINANAVLAPGQSIQQSTSVPSGKQRGSFSGSLGETPENVCSFPYTPSFIYFGC